MNSQRLMLVSAQARDHATRLQKIARKGVRSRARDDLEKVAIATTNSPPDVGLGSKAEMQITSR